MRIDEISSQSEPPQSQNHHNHHLLLSQIEASIKHAETLSPQNPSPASISTDLRCAVNQLSRFSPLPDSVKLLLWKLSYRLWNACVDLSNAAAALSPRAADSALAEEQAKLRNVAADLLFVAGAAAGIPSPEFKSAAFYHKAGVIWHELGRFELASACFERATDLVSKLDAASVSDAGERKLFLDLTLARARTAWEISDRKLAVALLSRAKSFLFGSAEHYKEVSGQYLVFGKSILSNGTSSGLDEALRLMNEALDLQEKALRVARVQENVVELKEMKLKTLRFISVVHLQMGEFEGVIKCVKVLREANGSEDRHPSLSVLAMKAWLGLQRYPEAEKELRAMVVNNAASEAVWVSAIDDYLQATKVAGAEAAKEVFLGLLGRCDVSASAAVRVAHRVLGSDESVGHSSKIREKVVAELVSDQRVMALFTGEATAKQRTAMHALLWNCGADNFRSKEYEISAEIFEKAMLYIPYDIESRALRGKGFRVLCLCHLALSHLDQALEYINEAEKLEPSIASAFLKFKIYLQRNEKDGAINQVQAMMSCLDFSPEYLSLSAHEAIACHVLPVAVAALSNLLSLYATGKSMPITEAVVLRTLVTILSQEPGNDTEVLKFVKRTYDRASELGPDCFFGKGEVGKREMKWFAVSSWNFGTKSGKESKFELCAKFLKLASDFYALLSDGQLEENNIMVCKSLILTVSALIASENKNKVTLTDTEVKQTAEVLDRAGKLLKSISTGLNSQLGDDQANAFDDDLFFIHAICAYDIRGRLNDATSQLLSVKSFAASKACSPNHLLQIGLNALQGPRANHEVSAFALNKCLSALLASPEPEYQTVALVLRKLISTAGTGYDAVHAMYKRTYRVMVGLKPGEYPVEEGKWLATTAWNRAALPLRLGRVDEGRQWMAVGLELAAQVPGMESYKASMEEFVGRFEKENCVGRVDDQDMPQVVID